MGLHTIHAYQLCKGSVWDLYSLPFFVALNEFKWVLWFLKGLKRFYVFWIDVI